MEDEELLWRLEAVFFSPPGQAAYSIFIGEIFSRYCTAIGALWGRAVAASDFSNIAHKVKMLSSASFITTKTE